MVGVAVNVTFAPAQIVVCAVLIFTDGVTFGNTVIVTMFDVDTGLNTHCSEDVITTFTTSLLASELDEYV